MMLLAGWINLQAKIFRAWATWLSLAVAGLNYAFVPTMYFGEDPIGSTPRRVSVHR